MTIQQLQYLLEVYHSGSISLAAQKLYVAQSSVSGAISTLERELGYPLFTRSRKGVSPTPEGLRVLEQASRICESCRIITERTASNRQTRIGASPHPATCEAFMRLTEEYAAQRDMSFSLLSTPGPMAVEKLSMFDLDLGLLLIQSCSMPAIESMMHTKRLHWTQLRTIPFVLRIGPGHRLYKQRRITPADLIDDTVVDTFYGGTVYSDFVKSKMYIDPNRVMPVSEQSARFELVRRGIAYSMGPKLPDRINEQYGFRSIPVSGVHYHLIAAMPDDRPSPEIERFLTLLMEEMADV